MHTKNISATTKKRTEEEIKQINEQSDNKSWATVAAMLYDVCKATYGEEFETWVEAKHYNKMKTLTEQQ